MPEVGVALVVRGKSARRSNGWQVRVVLAMSLVHHASLNLQKGDFMGKSVDIVNRFYDATDNRRMNDLRALVSEDVTFAGPLMTTTGSKEYVAMNEQLLQFH